MHIEKFKNNGIDYLRIMETYYVKEVKKQKRTVLKNLGPLSRYDDGKPDFLKRLREQFRNGEITFGDISYTTKSKSKLMFEPDNDQHEIQLKNIGYLLLDKVYKDLGIDKVLIKEKSTSKIDYDLNGLTKLCVFGRVLDPSSKKRTFEMRDRYLEPLTSSSDIHEVYRALDVLNKKSESIQMRMNTKIKNSSIGRMTDLTYYDVTNYYFETMYGDDDEIALDDEENPILDEKGKPIVLKKGFRKKGVCKSKSGKPLVAMGLFMDRNGIPVAYNTFSGNTQDKTTMKEMIKSTLNQADLGRIVVVADNGNHAQENLYLLITQGNGYILSKSVKQGWNTKPEEKDLPKMSEWALDDNDYAYKYNKKGVMVFKSKSRIYERTLQAGKHSITIKEKQVIFWSKGHYEREVHQNKKFIEYLESCKEKPDKLKDRQRKSQEFIKVLQTDKKTGEVIKTKPLVVLLDDKIKKYQETMGYYCIVTSEIQKPDSDIIASYHRLSRIEDSFRILKTNFDARPVYVWNPQRINAHFLICFIALTITRIIQHKVLVHQGKDTLNLDGWEQGITAQKIQEVLLGYQTCSDKNGVCLFTKIPDQLKLIFDSWGIDYNLARPTVDEFNKIKKRIANATLLYD